MARIVVDPITRIEGHLRIEATVENGVITDAYSSGTMVRGFEKILKAATRATPGPSPSAPAASARRSTRWPACAASRTRWTSRCPRTPS